MFYLIKAVKIDFITILTFLEFPFDLDYYFLFSTIKYIFSIKLRNGFIPLNTVTILINISSNIMPNIPLTINRLEHKI